MKICVTSFRSQVVRISRRFFKLYLALRCKVCDCGVNWSYSKRSCLKILTGAFFISPQALVKPRATMRGISRNSKSAERQFAAPRNLRVGARGILEIYYLKVQSGLLALKALRFDRPCLAPGWYEERGVDAPAFRAIDEVGRYSQCCLSPQLSNRS